jgi:hypothetical protein
MIFSSVENIEKIDVRNSIPLGAGDVDRVVA